MADSPIVLRIVTWSNNYLLKIIIIISYLKPYITVCKQITIIKQKQLLETIYLLVLERNTWKPYNHVQVICIRTEYLISYNCVEKALKKQLHKYININVHWT